MSKFAIQIDATNKDFPFGLFLLTEIGAPLLDATVVQTLMLESGKDFHFQIQAGVLPDWTFRVDNNGKVTYKDEFDVQSGGFLAGRGTTKLVLLGYEVTFDARSLSGGGVVLGVKGEKFGFIGLKTFRLLPQRHYQVIQGSGSTADFPFTVTLPASKGKAKVKGGIFDYDPQFDVCNDPRGFVAGRGTNLLQFVGYPIFINACAAGNAPVISNIQSLVVNRFPVMTFLPGPYRLGVVRGTGDEAYLDFLIDRKGEITKVSVDPPSDPFFLLVETVTRPALIVTLRHKPPS